MGAGGWLLAVDTATETTALALCRESEQPLVREAEGSLHSRRLLALAQELLAEAELLPGELSALGVGVGPGSFTGVRIGLTFAKSLALAFGLPLAAVGTLESLALGGQTGGQRCPVLVAHRGLVYAARYLPQADFLRQLDPPQAHEPAKLAERLAVAEGELELIGNGALRYRDIFVSVLGQRALIDAEHRRHRLQATALARLAWRRLRSGELADPIWLEPQYIRPPDAELALAGK